MKLINENGDVVAESESIAYDLALRGWRTDSGVITDPERVLTLISYAKVSPVEFMLLFTSPERIAIKAARQTDPVIDDWLDIVQDPRLTHVDLGLKSTHDALDYLTAQGMLDAGRKDEIIANTPQ